MQVLRRNLHAFEQLKLKDYVSFQEIIDSEPHYIGNFNLEPRTFTGRSIQEQVRSFTMATQDNSGKFAVMKFWSYDDSFWRSPNLLSHSHRSLCIPGRSVSFTDTKVSAEIVDPVEALPTFGFDLSKTGSLYVHIGYGIGVGAGPVLTFGVPHGEESIDEQLSGVSLNAGTYAFVGEENDYGVTKNGFTGAAFCR